MEQSNEHTNNHCHEGVGYMMAVHRALRQMRKGRIALVVPMVMARYGRRKAHMTCENLPHRRCHGTHIGRAGAWCNAVFITCTAEQGKLPWGPPL